MSDVASAHDGEVTEDRFVKVKHLSDAPVEEDSFAGNAHARTSKALIETIVNDNPAIRAIGLEGSWGSGKSSVIEIARKGLKGRKSAGPNYHLFTFDMWAHQGDPLRRSFLDKFVNWLRLQKRISESQKQEWLDQLTAKVTRTTTHSEPNMKPVGLVMLLLAPLLPLIYVWLSPLAFGQTMEKFSLFGYGRDAYQGFAFGLLLLPYVFLLVAWANEKRLGRAIMLLSRINDVEKSNQLIRDEDPTSVEFGNFLNSITSTSSDTNNIIIIVLDNLDRLPEDQISDAWAMMRGLIGREGDCARQEASRHVWLIVPYDKPHLMRALSGEQVGSENQHSDGFIEKTFDVVLRVSPPLLVHWREYFNQKCDEALSDALEPEEEHMLLRLLEYQFNDDRRPITPRSVKAYINNIVTIVQQWRSEIPVQYVALYVLKRRELEVDISALKEGSLLSDKHRSLLGGGSWQKYLAALHFNVSPEDAYQVLLGGDIERHLNNFDSEELEGLSENPGFSLVLGSLVDDRAVEWATQDAADFAHRCGTLVQAVEHSPQSLQVWRALGMATKYLSTFSSLNSGVVAGLSGLVDQLPAPEARETASLIIRRISGSPVGDDTFDGGRQWLNAIDSINTVLVEKSKKSRKISNISVPGNAQFVCGMLAHLRDSNSVEFSDFRVSTKPEDLTSELRNHIVNQKISIDLEAVLRALSSIPTLLQIGQVADTLRDRLRSNNPALDAQNALVLLRSLLVLMHHKTLGAQGRKRLEELSSDGTLLALFKKGRDDKSAHLSATASWCLSLINEAGAPPNPGNHSHYGELNTAHNHYVQFMSAPADFEADVQAIADLVAQYNDLSKLIDIALINGQKDSLFAGTLTAAIKAENYHQLNIEKIIKNYPKLSSLLSPDVRVKFISNLASWTDYLKADIAVDVTRGFLKAIFESGRDWHKVFDYVSEYLNSLDDEQWGEALNTEGKPVELLLGMLDTQGCKVPAGNFRVALEAHAKKVYAGELILHNYQDEWESLSLALGTQTRKSFYKNLLLWMKDNLVETAQLERLMSIYPNFLQNIPASNYPDTVIEKIFVPLVGQPKVKSLETLNSSLQVFKEAFENASADVRDLAIEAIQGAYSSVSGESVDEVHELAQKMSIELKTEDTSDEE